MRIDKFLKVSRILKRRSVAADACDGNKIFVNGKVVKPAYRLKIGDIIKIEFGRGDASFRVLKLDEKASKDAATELYEVINETNDE